MILDFFTWSSSASVANTPVRLFFKEMLTFEGHSFILLSVSFSPDGKWIASAGSYPERKDPSEIVIWDAQTGQERLTLKGHSESVHSVSFSPDGKRIVSGGSDKTIKVWDISSLDTSK